MTEVGNVYGQSLYELAKDEGLSKEIGEQLAVLQKSFGQEPDFVRLLASPNLPKAERCQILDTSFRGAVHPYVLNTMFAACERILRREENGLVVFDVPLLFECGADRRMDANVVVVAEDALRIARICHRSGMSEEAARARIRSQISQREQMARADYVIDNSGGLDALYAQVDRVYAALRENTAL